VTDLIDIFRWLLLHFLFGALFVFPAYFTIRFVRYCFSDRSEHDGSMFLHGIKKDNLSTPLNGRASSMAARLGNVLFWASVLFAALWFFAMLGPGGVSKGEEMQVYVGGAIIVLIGWALRYILAGRKA
jgi:hypothetical protein